jgi:hypothetical protein
MGGITKALIQGSRKPVSKLLKQAEEGDFNKSEIVLEKDPVELPVADEVKPVESPIDEESAVIDAAAVGKEELKPVVETVDEVASAEGQVAVDEVENEVVESVVKQDDQNKDKVGMGNPIPEPKESNISLKNAQTTDDLDALIARVSENNAAFEESRRGVVPNSQTVNESSNYSMEDLLGRKTGDAFNAAQVHSARTILLQSAKDLKDAAKKILNGQATEQDMLEFRQMSASHVAIQYQVSGMTAEAGRALQAFRITAKAESQVGVKQLSDALELSGGSGSAKALARIIVDSKNLKELNASTREVYGIKTTDLFFEHWINGLLSGPTTHFVNMGSNAAVMIHGLADRAAASGWSEILRSPPTDKVYADEAYAQVIGLIMGFDDSLKMAWKSFTTGTGQFNQMSKVEQRRYNSIDSTKISDLIKKNGFGSIPKDSALAKGIDLWGEFIRIPGRALQAEDDMFKVINYRMELNALAVRQARAEGLTGRELTDRIQELIDKPTQDIHMGAVDFADKNTFTNPLGEWGKSAQNAIHGMPVLKILMPFVRTLVNIQKYTLTRTPLALFAKSVRADLAAGGAKRDLALGKMTVGTMFSTWGLYQAMQGKITGGGHVWPGVRKSDYRQGWQAYSIQGPDGIWVRYDRFDPVGLYLGLVSDAYEISLYGTEKDANEAAMAVAMALYKNMSNKTYAQGFTQFHKAFTMGGNYWDNWVRNFGASMVPYTSLINTGKKMVDPVARDAQTVLERIRSRIPGLSTSLPPRVNLYGEPIVMTGGMMARGINPFRTSKPEPTFVDTEIRENEVNVNHVKSFLGAGRFKVDLDTQQHYDYKVFAGEELYLELQDLMWSELYIDSSKGPDGNRAVLIKQKVQELRGKCDPKTRVCTGAKEKLFLKYPQLELQWNATMDDKELKRMGY